MGASKGVGERGMGAGLGGEIKGCVPWVGGCSLLC
jgi:hypothetical protein